MRKLTLLLLLTATTAHAQDMPLKDILIEGENWKPFFKDCKSVGGLAVAASTDMWFSDPVAKRCYHVTSKGDLIDQIDDESPATGIFLLSGGGIGICFPEEKLIRHPGKNLKLDFAVRDAVAARKNIYGTLASDGAIVKLANLEQGKFEKVAEGLKDPAGLVLWPDESTLVVSELHGQYLSTYRIEKDGSLTCKEKYYTLRKPSGYTELTVGTMTVDDAGRLYCATNIGVQVFDPTGRMSGVLSKPKDEPITHVALGGEKGNTLFVACGNEIFARQIKGKGVPWKEQGSK
jgi:gluconolactonase